MPMYEYQCDKCSHVVEVLQRHDEPGPKSCPKPGCRSRKMARVMSNTSFQLVGSGWYKTDYAPKSGGGDSSGG